MSLEDSSPSATFDQESRDRELRNKMLLFAGIALFLMALALSGIFFPQIWLAGLGLKGYGAIVGLGGWVCSLVAAVLVLKAISCSYQRTELASGVLKQKKEEGDSVQIGSVANIIINSSVANDKKAKRDMLWDKFIKSPRACLKILEGLGEEQKRSLFANIGGDQGLGSMYVQFPGEERVSPADKMDLMRILSGKRPGELSVFMGDILKKFSISQPLLAQEATKKEVHQKDAAGDVPVSGGDTHLEVHG